MAFGPDGNLYIAGYLNDAVLRYDGLTGAFMNVFVSHGSGGLGAPIALTFTPQPVVPEPSTLIMFGVGAISLVSYTWQFAQKGNRT
jgi:hypothetical protein